MLKFFSIKVTKLATPLTYSANTLFIVNSWTQRVKWHREGPKFNASELRLKLMRAEKKAFKLL